MEEVHASKLVASPISQQYFFFSVLLVSEYLISLILLARYWAWPCTRNRMLYDMKAEISETDNCRNGNEASISRLIANVELTTKRVYLREKLSVTEESMKR